MGFREYGGAEIDEFVDVLWGVGGPVCEGSEFSGDVLFVVVKVIVNGALEVLVEGVKNVLRNVGLGQRSSKLVDFISEGAC